MSYNNYNRKPEYNSKKEESATDKFRELGFNPAWITTGATTDMINFADKAAMFMGEKNLTTSKIRSVYGEIKRIQMKKFEEERTAFLLLKPKLAYAVGREKATSKNCEGIRLFQLIFNECFTRVKDDATYKNFCNLMEALVAYHKVYQKGKD